MTTHEFDAYCDAQVCDSQDGAMDDSFLLAEQERDHYEMEAERAATLKRQGAKEALGELKHYLLLCAIDDRCRNEFFGLTWSIDSINRRLANIEVLQEGGAA